MLLGNCWISETAPPTILSSDAKNPLTKDFVLIAPFLDSIFSFESLFNVDSIVQRKNLDNFSYSWTMSASKV